MASVASATTSNKEEGGDDGLFEALQESRKKVEVSLLTSITEYVSSKDFSPSQHGLDFLHAKNSLLLSYLIDLTVMQRNRLLGLEQDGNNLERLVEMRTVLDKSRGLDKKLKYQIDKLLAVEANAASFATATVQESDDPLHFRPDVQAMEEDSNKQSHGDFSSSDDDDDEEKDDDDGKEDDLDDDLKAAQKTLSMAKAKKSVHANPSSSRNDDEDDVDADGVYRAPRFTAVPYTHDKVDREAEQERRQRRRARASELAQTLRTTYGDAPEQQDLSGGTELGKQREAAKRLADKQAAKTRYEEESMVRLVTTRAEKKARKQLMRQETSNLSAIADLGNLVRDTSHHLRGDRNGGRHETTSPMSEERHANGKRMRQAIDGDGRAVRESKGGFQAKNALQAELYRGGGRSKKSKGKSKR